MTYAETLDYLYRSLPMYQRVGQAAFKKDLTNTLALCAALGEPQRQFASVHVAGTNGKGSTSHLLAAALQAAGYRVGLYTSPHLRSFTERIRLNGAEIPEAEVVAFVAAHRLLFEQIQPSFFEMTVALAFWYFARERVDIAVIETGLGGRLDSTNVVTPVLSLITNISFDHREILGDTLPAIAAEKAGIIKPGVPVVVGEHQPEVADVFRQTAAERSAPLRWAADRYAVRSLHPTPSHQHFAVYAHKQPVGDPWALDLRGDYQARNLPGVLMALDVLAQVGWPVAEADRRRGLASATSLTGLRGRWEMIGERPLVVCDVAHNPAGLAHTMAQCARTPHRRLHVVLGVVREKELAELWPLLPPLAQYYFCAPDVPRALPVADLLAAATAAGLAGAAYPDVARALAAARAAAHPDDLIYVGGSTFVVAEVLPEKILALVAPPSL